jgi:hypothetical protein
VKFKVYAWSGFYKSPEGDYTHQSFELFPSIGWSRMRSDFIADKDADIAECHGSSVAVLVAWLFWGVTFDFRFGDDAK